MTIVLFSDFKDQREFCNAIPSVLPATIWSDTWRIPPSHLLLSFWYPSLYSAEYQCLPLISLCLHQCTPEYLIFLPLFVPLSLVSLAWISLESFNLVDLKHLQYLHGNGITNPAESCNLPLLKKPILSVLLLTVAEARNKTLLCFLLTCIPHSCHASIWLTFLPSKSHAKIYPASL